MGLPFDPENFDCVDGKGGDFSRHQPAVGGQPVKIAKRKISSYRMVQDNSLTFAVFRDQDNAGFDRILRRLELNWFAFKEDGAGHQRIRAGDGPDQFRTPGSDDAGDAKDLTGPPRKADV